MGAGRPRRQNCTFGVDKMVRIKVFKGAENFWVRRKIFRAERISHRRKNLWFAKKRSPKKFVMNRQKMSAADMRRGGKFKIRPGRQTP